MRTGPGAAANKKPATDPEGRNGMARLLKALLFLVLIAFLGLVGYAYLGDLSPGQTDMRKPVQLDVGG